MLRAPVYTLEQEVHPQPGYATIVRLDDILVVDLHGIEFVDLSHTSLLTSSEDLKNPLKLFL